MSNRDGFSIVEVVVSMMLLSIILTTLAGFTFSTARTAQYASDASARQAVALELMNRYLTLPFDSLVSRCDIVGETGNRYQRCVSVTMTGTLANIQITTTPQQRAAKPSTVRFRRVMPPPPNPLCTGC